MEFLSLLNWRMICPHPQPFSLGRREPELLFPLPRGSGSGEGNFWHSYLNSATPNFTKMSTKSNAHRNAIQPCDWPIKQLPGLSPQEQCLLLECGITSTLTLIHKASTPANRQTTANQLQLHIQHLNKWVALADLARIPSVGCQYCGLLLHVGISSVTQLAQIPVHKLHRQILRLQVAVMQRRDLCPSIEQVQQWVQQARSL